MANRQRFYGRRSTFRLAGGLLTGGLALGSVGAANSGAEIHDTEAIAGSNSVRVEYSVPEDATDEDDLRVRAFTEAEGQISDSPGLAMPGDERASVSVPLDRELQEDESVVLAVLPSGGYRDLASVEEDALAMAEATAREGATGIGPTLVEADPDAGFEYPYYLYAPAGHYDDDQPVFVEPNNTGTSTDDFEEHRERAEQTVRQGGGRDITDALTVPLVVPVFPRPRDEPEDWSHYVHALDDTTMAIDDGPLERVDRQLLAMVDDARERLAAEDIATTSDLMLDGFSASGNFVDRFAVLHPERVLSVTAGGLNGMALLPQAERDGHTLPFHVGIADVEDLTGEPVDLDALDDTNQFLYMGGEDDNDTIPFDDAWTDDDLRQVALDVYGDDMITERFPTCQAAYEDAGVSAQFRVYPDEGHSPRAARGDVIEFHRRSIEGEDVSDMGEDLAGTVTFDIEGTVTAGEELTFDAGDTEGGVAAVSRYLWAFGDGESATGETTTHAFEEPGEYDVELEVILDDGGERSTVQTVSVSEESEADAEEAETEEPTAETETPTENPETDEPESDPSGEENDGSAEETPADVVDDGDVDEDAPGFGVVGALSALGGAGYVLKRRVERTE